MIRKFFWKESELVESAKKSLSGKKIISTFVADLVPTTASAVGMNRESGVNPELYPQL